MGARVGLALFLIALLLMFALVGCERIGAGHVGLKIDLAGTQRGIEQLPIRTGWVWYFKPSSTVVEYPTYVQTAVWTASPHEGDNPNSPTGTNEEISFNDSQGLNVNADISLSYQLTEKKIPDFYVQFRNDDIKLFTHGFLRNVARDAFGEAGGHYKIEGIMGEQKEEYVKDVTKRLQDKVSSIGVNIIQLGFLNSPRPPQSVSDSIRAKAQATQLALQKQNELVQAEADAKKSVAKAEGEAKSAVALAEGQAKANHLLSESLTDKVLERIRLDLQWHMIDKWDGTPTHFVSGNGSSGAMLFQMPQPVK